MGGENSFGDATCGKDLICCMKFKMSENPVLKEMRLLADCAQVFRLDPARPEPRNPTITGNLDEFAGERSDCSRISAILGHGQQSPANLLQAGETHRCTSRHQCDYSFLPQTEIALEIADSVGIARPDFSLTGRTCVSVLGLQEWGGGCETPERQAELPKKA